MKITTTIIGQGVLLDGNNSKLEMIRDGIMIEKQLKKVREISNEKDGLNRSSLFYAFLDAIK